MLEIMKIYFPTNFQAYLMNIGRIITKKSNYDNMQMSFWAKIAKNPQNRPFFSEYDDFCSVNPRNSDFVGF